MGLDALVYRNAETLRREVGLGHFELDLDTCEPLFEDDSRNIKRSDIVSLERRFGNISEVMALRSLVSGLAGSQTPLILEKILASGSHSGDVIKVSEFAKLRSEIEWLAKKEEPRLADFLQGLKTLVEAGEKEGNPIVFV